MSLEIKVKIAKEKEPVLFLVPQLVVEKKCCPDPKKALEELRKRMQDLCEDTGVCLRPLQHKAPCLAHNKELAGVFGSYLKGVYDGNSDLDYAVYYPDNFRIDIFKKLFDRTYYLVKASYGVYAYGSLANTDVDLYLVYPGKRFVAFEIDGATACSLNSTDVDKIKEVKKLARDLGVYGEFGGVPGIGIEWAQIYARERRLDLASVVKWPYVPVRFLSGYLAGNTMGRTFYVNQRILGWALEGKTSPTDASPIVNYVRSLMQLSESSGETFEYYVVGESLPSSVVYTAWVATMEGVLGESRARYLAKHMGIWGQSGNTFLMGLIAPAIWTRDNKKYAAAPDKVSALSPYACAVGADYPISLEGGISCIAEKLAVVDLRSVVRASYRSYREALGAIYDKFVTARIV
jgi:predicted nucleotidyltransferase